MNLHSELIFIWKASHLESFWKKGTRELGNGLSTPRHSALNSSMFVLTCFPPNNPMSACGAISSPGYHSFLKWAIELISGVRNKHKFVVLILKSSTSNLKANVFRTLPPAAISLKLLGDDSTLPIVCWLPSAIKISWISATRLATKACFYRILLVRPSASKAAFWCLTIQPHDKETIYHSLTVNKPCIGHCWTNRRDCRHQ